MCGLMNSLSQLIGAIILVATSKNGYLFLANSSERIILYLDFARQEYRSKQTNHNGNRA